MTGLHALMHVEMCTVFAISSLQLILLPDCSHLPTLAVSGFLFACPASCAPHSLHCYVCCAGKASGKDEPAAAAAAPAPAGSRQKAASGKGQSGLEAALQCEERLADDASALPGITRQYSPAGVDSSPLQ